MKPDLDLVFKLIGSFAQGPTVNKVSPQTEAKLTDAVELIVEALKTCDVPKHLEAGLLAHACFFTNMVRMSKYKTTDSFLPHFEHSPLKLMFMYSALNDYYVDSGRFFAYDEELASTWFAQYMLPVSARIKPEVDKRIRDHYKNMHPKCRFTASSSKALFLIDYVDPSLAPKVKQQLRDNLELPTLEYGQSNDSVAVVCSNWSPNHVVYRCLGSFVKALATKYRVSLIHAGALLKDIAPLDIFERVSVVELKDGILDLGEIKSAKFAAVIFLDAGMTAESILLSGMRLSDIQIAMAGHGVSTHSKQMDYFINGSEVELPTTPYREKLVLVPGLGIQTAMPKYKPEACKNSGHVCIPWSGHKYDPYLMNRLLALPGSDARLQFIPGLSVVAQQGAYGYLQDMWDTFHNTVDILPPQRYDKYMEALASCYFSLDSFPFGGYNTVVDALWVGKPVVVYEGDRWQNRIAAALLRHLNLPELVAKGRPQFFELATRLLTDKAFLDEMTTRVQNVDLAQKLLNMDESSSLVQAVEFIIKTKPSNQVTYLP